MDRRERGFQLVGRLQHVPRPLLAAAPQPRVGVGQVPIALAERSCQARGQPPDDQPDQESEAQVGEPKTASELTACGKPVMNKHAGGCQSAEHLQRQAGQIEAGRSHDYDQALAGWKEDARQDDVKQIHERGGGLDAAEVVDGDRQYHEIHDDLHPHVQLQASGVVGCHAAGQEGQIAPFSPASTAAAAHGHVADSRRPNSSSGAPRAAATPAAARIATTIQRSRQNQAAFWYSKSRSRTSAVSVVRCGGSSSGNSKQATPGPVSAACSIFAAPTVQNGKRDLTSLSHPTTSSVQSGIRVSIQVTSQVVPLFSSRFKLPLPCWTVAFSI